MEKLSDSELQESLRRLPKWKLVDGGLVREWTFKDFVKAIDFVNQVAGLAESRGHHPDFDIRYNKVKLALVTHDVGGITVNDVEMCALVDKSL